MWKCFLYLWVVCYLTLLKSMVHVLHIPPSCLAFSRHTQWPHTYMCGLLFIYTHTWASLVAQMVKNPAAMRETWVQSLGWEDPLEKGTTTHSSILAWRIPWTEEPGGLQFMWLQRVRHDWATEQQQQYIFALSVFFCELLEEAKGRRWGVGINSVSS